MPQFYDISLNLDHTTIPWPGDVRFSRVENRGSGITSKLELSTHSGTHIDAPKHFFERGSVDEIDLKKLIGPCQIFEIRPLPPPAPSPGLGREEERSKRNLIQLSHVSKYKISRGERILFKTRNSALYKKGKFTGDYVSLSLEAAQFLVKKKISLVGIDYLGIEAKSAPGHPVHKALLKAGIVILEGLDLSKVKAGSYNLAALPLKIKAGDGSPARAVLWR